MTWSIENILHIVWWCSC